MGILSLGTRDKPLGTSAWEANKQWIADSLQDKRPICIMSLCIKVYSDIWSWVKYMKHNHSASMTKQFVSEARGSMTPSVRIVDLIKYAHAGHMIFIIIWWHLSQNKVICPPRKRKRQNCSIYVYQKVQNENHIMQSNESVNSRTITVTKPIKLLSAQQGDCACSVRFIFHNF